MYIEIKIRKVERGYGGGGVMVGVVWMIEQYPDKVILNQV
jgi:hypothetical protein